MKKILFIDRDGTLIVEPKITKQINSIDEIIFLKGVISSLKILAKNGFELVIVTNQDGLGTNSNPIRNYEKINDFILKVFESEGIKFEKIFVCPHFESDNCNCRKPKLGILNGYLSSNFIDYKNSYVIGDRDTDIEFAKNIGVVGFKIGNNLCWETITNKILLDNKGIC